MKLYIGNKNYSSWSLRGWLLLAGFDVQFEEVQLSLKTNAFKHTLQALGAPGLLPVLVDGELVIWDTLAIAEHIAERFPERGVWPTDPAARALARSMCAEMHSGFGALRSQLPMNIEAHLPGRGWNLAVQADVARITELWLRARTRFGADGPFLFGNFSAADAFYAPVVYRFVTYGLEVPDLAREYMDALRSFAPVKRWEEAALNESEFLAEDEPYRPHGGR